MTNPKQVIIMRKDLNMRKGKMIAQGAHASSIVLLNYWYISNASETVFLNLKPEQRQEMHDWLHGNFKKVCVSVNSENELLDIYNRAVKENIICSLIKDSGLTEFNNIPTLTCCAIGPDSEVKIDKITGHLPLL